jgi:hypothetical protein
MLASAVQHIGMGKTKFAPGIYEALHEHTVRLGAAASARAAPDAPRQASMYYQWRASVEINVEIERA